MELFDHLKAITETKEELNPRDEEACKSYQPYLINRFVSMCELFIPIVSLINKYPNIPKVAHQTFYRNILPQRKQYFKYIKKSKEKNDEAIECISKYYDIGRKEAEQYFAMLTDEQVEKICKKFVYGKTR